MRKKIGCFSEEQLREYASQPGVTVMQPAHDITYAPLASDQVAAIVDELVELTASSAPPSVREAVARSPRLSQFASTHKVMYAKLTDPDFVSRPGNVALLKRLIEQRSLVESGAQDEVQAKANASDIALKHFAALVGDAAGRAEGR